MKQRDDSNRPKLEKQFTVGQHGKSANTDYRRDALVADTEVRNIFTL